MNLEVSTPIIRFNLSTTLTNLNGDMDLLQAIACIFHEDIPAILLALQEACARDDHNQVRHFAHIIKGMASNFHAEPLTTLARKLESNRDFLTVSERQELVFSIVSVGELTIAELKKEMDK
jgi:HPt (histidine-containing phosphotransfer) domain-containing protein